MNSNHDHRHHSVSSSWRRLSLVLFLTAFYMVAEVVGALWTGSLALLADAGHMFTDVAALILALSAVWFGSRPATSRKTFGYYRLEIIAALVNGVALVVMALRSEEHTSELQSPCNLVCRLLLEKKTTRQ